MGTQGEVPSAGDSWGMCAHLGGHALGACMGAHTRSWVLLRAPPRAPPLPCSLQVLSGGRFSAPLATAVPAHNDMVIASGGLATRTARLAGQPSPHRGYPLPGGSHHPLPSPAWGTPASGSIRGLPQWQCGGEAPRQAAVTSPARELGNLSFPVVFTRVRGVLRRCTSHFLLGHFHLCPRIMIFSATLI